MSRGTRGIGKLEAITNDNAEEGRGRNTKNLYRSSFGEDRRVGGDRLTPHLGLPEGVAGHPPADLAICLILGLDQPALKRNDAQHTEKISAHLEPVHVARLIGIAHLDVSGAPGKNAGEWVVVLLDLLPHGHGEVRILTVGN